MAAVKDRLGGKGSDVVRSTAVVLFEGKMEVVAKKDLLDGKGRPKCVGMIPIQGVLWLQSGCR